MGILFGDILIFSILNAFFNQDKLDEIYKLFFLFYYHPEKKAVKTRYFQGYSHHVNAGKSKESRDLSQGSFDFQLISVVAQST